MTDVDRCSRVGRGPISDEARFGSFGSATHFRLCITCPTVIIHVGGVGERAVLLNQFTSNANGCTVFASPVEATVFGNLIQACAVGEIGSLDEIRRISGAVGNAGVPPPSTHDWQRAAK